MKWARYFAFGCPAGMTLLKAVSGWVPFWLAFAWSMLAWAVASARWFDHRRIVVQDMQGVLR